MLEHFSRLWKDLAWHNVIKYVYFLEHRVTIAMIYVKFNNHKRIISYSLWKGHGEMKISPWKKITFANIFTVERCTDFKFPTIKENTKTHVWSKNHGSGFLCMQVIYMFQLYTCLKCTQSTYYISYYQPMFLIYWFRLLCYLSSIYTYRQPFSVI